MERDSEFQSIAEMPGWRNGTLLPITDPAQIDKLKGSNFTGCVIVAKDLLPKVPKHVGVIVSEQPLETLYDIHNLLVKSGSFYKSSKESIIDNNAEIHHTAMVADKGVRIGKGCIIGPNAIILEGSTLENNVIIGPGSVIGREELLSFRKGSVVGKVISSGEAILREDVRVHANCNVSRAIFGGSTEIRAGVNIDNLVSIGRNTKIGERTFIVARASIGQNVELGEEVWIGPNSTVSSGVTIGDRAHVTIGAVVIGDVGQDKKVTGNYAIDHDLFIERLKMVR